MTRVLFVPAVHAITLMRQQLLLQTPDTCTQARAKSHSMIIGELNVSSVTVTGSSEQATFRVQFVCSFNSNSKGLMAF
jgi:hypothetical protein